VTVPGVRFARTNAVARQAFEDYFGDAVQTIYDNITSGGVGNTHIAFSSAAAIMTWTLMNVNNPDPLLMLEDPLTNTSQVDPGRSRGRLDVGQPRRDTHRASGLADGIVCRPA
jgi:hypothetical protein